MTDWINVPWDEFKNKYENCPCVVDDKKQEITLVFACSNHYPKSPTDFPPEFTYGEDFIFDNDHRLPTGL